MACHGPPRRWRDRRRQPLTTAVTSKPAAGRTGPFEPAELDGRHRSSGAGSTAFQGLSVMGRLPGPFTWLAQLRAGDPGARRRRTVGRPPIFAIRIAPRWRRGPRNLRLSHDHSQPLRLARRAELVSRWRCGAPTGHRRHRGPIRLRSREAGGVHGARRAGGRLGDLNSASGVSRRRQPRRSGALAGGPCSTRSPTACTGAGGRPRVRGAEGHPTVGRFCRRRRAGSRFTSRRRHIDDGRVSGRLEMDCAHHRPGAGSRAGARGAPPGRGRWLRNRTRQRRRRQPGAGAQPPWSGFGLPGGGPSRGMAPGTARRRGGDLACRPVFRSTRSRSRSFPSNLPTAAGACVAPASMFHDDGGSGNGSRRARATRRRMFSDSAPLRKRHGRVGRRTRCPGAVRLSPSVGAARAYASVIRRWRRGREERDGADPRGSPLLRARPALVEIRAGVRHARGLRGPVRRSRWSNKPSCRSPPTRGLDRAAGEAGLSAEEKRGFELFMLNLIRARAAARDCFHCHEARCFPTTASEQRPRSRAPTKGLGGVTQRTGITVQRCPRCNVALTALTCTTAALPRSRRSSRYYDHGVQQPRSIPISPAPARRSARRGGSTGARGVPARVTEERPARPCLRQPSQTRPSENRLLCLRLGVAFVRLRCPSGIRAAPHPAPAPATPPPSASSSRAACESSCANGIPDHATGPFPGRGNPNTISPAAPGVCMTTTTTTPGRRATSGSGEDADRHEHGTTTVAGERGVAAAATPASTPARACDPPAPPPLLTACRRRCCAPAGGSALHGVAAWLGWRWLSHLRPVVPDGCRGCILAAQARRHRLHRLDPTAPAAWAANRAGRFRGLGIRAGVGDLDGGNGRLARRLSSCRHLLLCDHG